jgi:hypothetical protein
MDRPSSLTAGGTSTAAVQGDGEVELAGQLSATPPASTTALEREAGAVGDGAGRAGHGLDVELQDQWAEAARSATRAGGRSAKASQAGMSRDASPKRSSQRRKTSFVAEAVAVGDLPAGADQGLVRRRSDGR